MRTKYKKELFICECGSMEHQLVFIYDENDFDELYAEVYLENYRNFWQRLKYGVRYIFGHKSNTGAFACLLLNPDDHEQFQGVATKLTELYNKREGNG